jgi:putative endonuclease
MHNGGFIYFMANEKHGVIYIGVTSDLIQRSYQHREGITKGFTWKYNCKRLVYYEIFESIESAILMEKKLKNLPRAKKIDIIERTNPEWEDLYAKIAA